MDAERNSGNPCESKIANFKIKRLLEATSDRTKLDNDSAEG